MNILLFGESCTGKSSIASRLESQLHMKTYSGKDYLRLAKNPNDAVAIFKDMLNKSDEFILFVVAEEELIHLVPKTVTRILLTADLNTIKKRFSVRFKGNLPKPIEQMLERKHGMFDQYESDLRFEGDQDIEEIVKSIIEYVKQ